MKNLFCLIALFCLVIFNTQAQPLLQYSNTYSYPGTGSEFGISIAPDDSGNAYVTGITDANGNNDIITIKYSPNGTKLWEKIYIGAGNDDDKPVKVITKNNKVYVTGYTYSSSTGYDWVTISYNASNGNENWVKTYNDPNNGDDKATGIVVDSAGYIYVSGSAYNLNNLNKIDPVVIKYNISGNFIRQVPLNLYPNNATIMDLAVNPSNQIFFTASNIIGYSTAKAYVTDTAFNLIGSVYTYGNSAIFKKIIPHSNFYYVLSIDPTFGTRIIKRAIGAGSNTWTSNLLNDPANSTIKNNGIDMTVDRSGNPYAICYDSVLNNAPTVYKFIKLDGTTGDSSFIRIFDPSLGLDYPISIKVGKQSTPTVYITGNSIVNSKLQNFTTGYNSSTGAALWTLNQSCPGIGDKSIADMQLDGYNNIYMTGHSNCSGNDDALAVKYCASLPVANAGKDTVVCAGNTVQIGTTSLPNYLYSWTPITGLSSAIISNPSASASGTYILTVTSPSGCSTNDTVMVIVNPLPNTPVITQRHDTLFSSETGTTYSWYKGVSLVGSNSFYKLTSTGTYTLKITNSLGCTSLASNTLNVTVITGVRSNSSIINSLEIYPNPSSENLNIRIQSKQNTNAQLRIFDVSGKEIFVNELKAIKGETIENIDVSNFAKGIYVIQLTDVEGITNAKFVVK